MTALVDALTAAGHTPAQMPQHRPVPLPSDPQLLMHHWNHACPHPGCMTWVPNHRHACANHKEA